MADTKMIPKGRAAVPWSEKYRPQSLDEVAAHKDIIDTSTCSLFKNLSL